jgi:hypothetical protein
MDSIAQLASNRANRHIRQAASAAAILVSDVVRELPSRDLNKGRHPPDRPISRKVVDG